MSVRRLAAEQPESFVFSPELEAFAAQQIEKYPEGRQASAVVPLLWEAQKEAGGWLPEPAIRAVADRLGMAHIRVLEIATFYTMFNLAPVGKYFVQLCGTTPCMLRGSDDIKAVCRSKIGAERHVTADGKFSWLEVECLGACANAPMVQINDDYYEDLTAENFAKLLDDLAAGRPVTVGSQTGRLNAAPEGGPRVLTDPTLYDGHARTAPAAAGPAETPDLLQAAKPRAATESPADPTGAKSAAQEKAADGKDTREKREEIAKEAQASSPSATGSDRSPPQTSTGVRDPKE